MSRSWEPVHGRYALFCGAHYYPGGGLRDYEHSYDTLAEAKSALHSRLYNDEPRVDWAHIVDLRWMKVVVTEHAERDAVADKPPPPPPPPEWNGYECFTCGEVALSLPTNLHLPSPVCGDCDDNARYARNTTRAVLDEHDNVVERELEEAPDYAGDA